MYLGYGVCGRITVTGMCPSEWNTQAGWVLKDNGEAESSGKRAKAQHSEERRCRMQWFHAKRK